MNILIGKQGQQPFKLTESSISREHAILHIDEATGRMTLIDKNSTNGTWILANDGTFKRLTKEVTVAPDTLVRLGAQYTFRIKEVLKAPEQPAVDISRLGHIYENYSKTKLKLEAKTSNVMMWRMASLSLGSILALAISVFLPEDMGGDPTISIVVKIVCSVLALGLSWMIVDMMNKSLIRQKDQNETSFKKNYCCPKCGYHFGTTVYQNLLASGRCPNNNCKCKFTGKI